MEAMTNHLEKRIDLKSLPKDKARVELAKDVIAAIKAKRLIAESGTYVRGDGPTVVDSIKSTTPCYVCALGACFVALAARGETDAVLDNELDYDVTCNRLEPWFSRPQLKEIEASFERWNNFFPDRSLSDEDRLVAIMQNIIDNGGDFTLQC